MSKHVKGFDVFLSRRKMMARQIHVKVVTKT